MVFSASGKTLGFNFIKPVFKMKVVGNYIFYNSSNKIKSCLSWIYFNWVRLGLGTTDIDFCREHQLRPNNQHIYVGAVKISIF